MHILKNYHTTCLNVTELFFPVNVRAIQLYGKKVWSCKVMDFKLRFALQRTISETFEEEVEDAIVNFVAQ